MGGGYYGGWGGMGWGMGGYGGTPGVRGNFLKIREISRKFPGNFLGSLGMAAIIQNDIMGRQLKIFTIRLHKNNPEIIPDPTLE